jgi:hypothetical protein
VSAPRLEVERRSGPGRRLRIALRVTGLVLVSWAALTLVLGGVARIDRVCETCHSMKPYDTASHAASHASLDCTSCHPNTALLVGDGLAMQRWAVRQLFGRSPIPTGFADGACRACHADALKQTVVGNSIRVRHIELLERPCADCHGGTGHLLQTRVYGVSQMAECTECHEVRAYDPKSCDFCHEPDSDRVEPSTTTQWEATHGPGWESTHGMGDLSGCVDCHEPSKCASCHDVALPHPGNWQSLHGQDLTAEGREACVECHEAEWCSACHQGVEMPHPATFLRDHGPEAERVGRETCLTCHPQAGCDDCHVQSAHPNIPDVPGHTVGD